MSIYGTSDKDFKEMIKEAEEAIGRKLTEKEIQELYKTAE